MYCGQSNFEYKNHGEFKTEFENVLGYELRDQKVFANMRTGVPRINA
jgi:hypothetical protein